MTHDEGLAIRRRAKETPPGLERYRLNRRKDREMIESYDWWEADDEVRAAEEAGATP